MRDGVSVAKVTQHTGVYTSTVYRFKRSQESGNQEQLQKLLDTKNNHPGRQPVLSHYEERMIVERTVFASRHGFAVDNNLMMTLRAQIAFDGRRTYEKTLPSSDTIRRFRARNRDLTFGVAEKVPAPRLDSENGAYIDSLRITLMQVAKENPGILDDPRRIWNWDETAVSGELEKLDALSLPVHATAGLERLSRILGNI